MKNWILLLALFSLCTASAWAKSPIDDFYPYLEHDSFSETKCKHPRKGVVCGASANLIQIYAEKDRTEYYIADYSLDPKDITEIPEEHAMMLTIKRRSKQTRPFKIYEFRIQFTYRDGIIVTYRKDYYDHFAVVRKNTQIPYAVRVWMVGVMRALKPGFAFTPRE